MPSAPTESTGSARAGDDAEIARCTALVDALRAAGAAHGGCLGFDEYMQLVLYHPTLGYYTSSAERIGAAGDFVTAPEMSPVFGTVMANALAPVLATLQHPTVLELGPGSGRLAIDLLTALERLEALPRRYAMLEVSGALRARQQQAIAAALAPHLARRVEWLDRLPDTLEGVVVANEVLDALPVHLIQRDQARVVERVVVTDPEPMTFATRTLPPALAAAVDGRLGAYVDRWPASYETEINLWLSPWLATIADVLVRGVVLLCDYGASRHDLYAPERSGGTLVCHRRHRAGFDPLVDIGRQDLSAWVDFTAVAEAAVEAGLEVRGYATQAHFLLECGIEETLAAAQRADARGRLEQAQALRRLLLPGEMGERFKVMALARDWPHRIAGFGRYDQRHRL